MSGSSAFSAGLQACQLCHKLNTLDRRRCLRCDSRLHARKPHSLQRTLALTIAASVLILPAHLLPIMVTSQLGRDAPSTIIGGAVTLWHHGSYPIAAVVFIASVVVPVAKLLALYWLVFTLRRASPASAPGRTTLYLLTEWIGPWSMVDIFVVAVLVALVRIDGVIVIVPGWATFSFAAMVVVTLFAAASYDPRLVWDRLADGANDDG